MTNEENAKKVVEILDQMEQEGEFEGLTPEEKEIERQILDMSIRLSM